MADAAGNESQTLGSNDSGGNDGYENQQEAIYWVSLDTMLKREPQRPLLHCAKAMRLMAAGWAGQGTEAYGVQKEATYLDSAIIIRFISTCILLPAVRLADSD